MYFSPAPISLSSAYTCASSLIASLTRRMSCSWLPGWQCTSSRQSSISCRRSVSTSSRISLTNRPNLDFSPAESRQRPAPSLASLTRTPMRGRTWYFSACRSTSLQLVEILDDRNDRAAELGREDHGFDVAVVLEAVADDHAIRRVLGQRHDREQLGLGAGLQAEAEFLAVAIHLFDDQALLVHLDREHRAVAVLVVVFGDRLRERLVQARQAVTQDVGEAHHDRRRQIARLQSLDDFEQIDLALGRAVGPHDDVPGRIDAEVALAPGGHLVQIERILGVPLGVRREFFCGVGPQAGAASAESDAARKIATRIAISRVERSTCVDRWPRHRVHRFFLATGRDAIADPFAPRAGVQPRAGLAGDFHREQQIAGGHAGAAHDDRVIVGDAGLRSSKRAAQLLRAAAKRPFAAEIGRERMIARARHVAGDGVDRLDFAGEALGRARIEQTPVGVPHALGDFAARRTTCRGSAALRNVSARRARNLGGRRQSGGGPGLEAAVEHRDRAMADPAQQPPQARRVDAVVGVVGDDLRRRRHAPAGRAWPRSAPAAAADAGRSSA